MLMTIVILVIASVAIIFSLRQSYYSSARQALEYRVRSTMSKVPTTMMMPAERISAIRSLVEDFDEKSKFEFMLVGDNGNVLVTSSGFDYDSDEPLEDYIEATRDSSGQGYFIGESATGEHIIAMTQLLVNQIGDAQAIRFVSSLGSVDRELLRLTQIIVLVCVIIIAFVVLSGIYFIRSIVIPINKIGATARQIAGGDFNVRIENNYNDEIGELCDIINDMASGLGEADNVKNEFISSVSHELRTPLTSIKGWGETLSAIGPGDKKNFEKGMKIIITETDRLSILVEDLLDFSRFQNSTMRLKTEPLDLVSEVNDAISIIEQRANRMKIKINFTPPAGAVIVDADNNRLKQVFANIFDNAIKYSSMGDSITVDFKTDGGFAHVTIKDTGLGIPKDELPLIFNKFYKASNSVTGSGIGLAVVNEIVTRHGGALNIVSELGRGTAVTVSLPYLEIVRE